MTTVQDSDRAVVPTEVEIASARAAVTLIRHASSSRKFYAKGYEGRDVEFSDKIGDLFLNILEEIANGNVVHVLAEGRELTTQQAADILRVSRPYLIRLLDEERIPSHKVGTHRRVLYKDIKAYGAQRWSRRKKTLDKLAALDQELGLND